MEQQDRGTPWPCVDSHHPTYAFSGPSDYRYVVREKTQTSVLLFELPAWILIWASYMNAIFLILFLPDGILARLQLGI